MRRVVEAAVSALSSVVPRELTADHARALFSVEPVPEFYDERWREGASKWLYSILKQ